ncbi:MAG: NAD(P)/FAD-dependent oxidoreductase [Bacilli bacterium]|jgi:NADPH-dependent 2,4-dienoyl-CoA reductase/sulfur reductase-like enzyme
MKSVDVIIIGGGSAGMVAAISCYDSGIKDILIIEKNDYLGGILNQCIHNGFGLTEFKEELTGPEFMSRFSSQIKQRKIPYCLNSFVLEITREKVVSYVNPIDGYVQVRAKAIIVATGCYERSAGAIAIPGSRPSGVITAGNAQLYLNIYGYLVGKRVFILGSGDIGLIMARRLTLEGATVLGVAELMPYSNGLNRNIVQCLNDYHIPLYLSHTVSRIIGKNHVEAIEISQVDSSFKVIPGSEKRFDVDTLLLSVGLIPNSNLLSNIDIPLSSTRGVKVDEYMQSESDGIFSCGNVLHVHDLVDYVVREARLAGQGASLYVRGLLAKMNRYITCVNGNDIAYVVPQRVHLDSLFDTEFKFRVRKPLRNQVIAFYLNDKLIKKVMKLAIIPSEMEIVKIDRSLLNQEGVLRIEMEDMVK